MNAQICHGISDALGDEVSENGTDKKREQTANDALNEEIAELGMDAVCGSLEITGVGSNGDNPVPGLVVNVLHNAFCASLWVIDDDAASLLPLERGTVGEYFRQPGSLGIGGEPGGFDHGSIAEVLAVFAVIYGD